MGTTASILIIQLITSAALMEGIEPDTAIAIAKMESSLRVNAVGSKNEIGLFQILPQYSKYSVSDLKNPLINIKEGLRILKEAKNNCVHQLNKTWVICHNVGLAGAKKIKYPEKFPYYVKFVQTRQQLKEKINNIRQKKETKYASLQSR